MPDRITVTGRDIMFAGETVARISNKLSGRTVLDSFIETLTETPDAKAGDCSMCPWYDPDAS